MSEFEYMLECNTNIIFNVCCRDFATGPYTCYGCDVGIYSTGKFTIILHHAQFNQSKWARPGPYIAKNTKMSRRSEQHFPMNKWKLPDCILKLLTDEQVCGRGCDEK